MLWRRRSKPLDGCSEPRLPAETDDLPTRADCLHATQHRGWRMLARRHDDSVRLITRNGNDWTLRYPRVAAAVLGLPCTSCLIDGVVMIAGGLDRVPDPKQESRVKRRAVLYVLDLLELDGVDLRCG